MDDNLYNMWLLGGSDCLVADYIKESWRGISNIGYVGHQSTVFVVLLDIIDISVLLDRRIIEYLVV